MSGLQGGLRPLVLLGELLLHETGLLLFFLKHLLAELGSSGAGALLAQLCLQLLLLRRSLLLLPSPPLLLLPHKLLLPLLARVLQHALPRFLLQLRGSRLALL